jgi:predicted RNA-binding protein
MCEAHAFILKDGTEEQILESVDEVEVIGNEVRLVNIFGEQKIIKAKIQRYSNREGKIVLEAL